MGKIRQIIVSGGLPAAVLALSEDGAAFVLEATLVDVGPLGRRIVPGMPNGQELNYSWRRLPELP